MDALILALGPAFGAGFAVQRALEILGSILDLISTRWAGATRLKAVTLGLVSFGIGWALAAWAGISVLNPLTDPDPPRIWDILVTALVVSAGTEGLNSILKFLQYQKEEQKGEATQAKMMGEAAAGGAVAAERSMPS